MGAHIEKWDTNDPVLWIELDEKGEGLQVDLRAYQVEYRRKDEKHFGIICKKRTKQYEKAIISLVQLLLVKEKIRLKDERRFFKCLSMLQLQQIEGGTNDTEEVHDVSG